MPAYVIVEIRMTNPEAVDAFNEYASRTTELLNKAGVKVTVFDQAPRVLEGDWKPAVVVVQEYPDMAAVDNFYNSEEYKPLRAIRAKFSANNVIAVEGFAGFPGEA